MKKVLFLVYFCIIGFCNWNIQAVNPETIFMINETNLIPNGFEKIELLGSLNYGIGPNAIEAGASDDAVYIQFNQSFGNVNISIYNGMGALVYNTTVNTDVQQIFIIPFANVASGNYVIELSNATGYAEGDFEHN